MEPLMPRITKSTAIAAIKARFKTTEDLLKRFEVAKNQANNWDGERDGLREVVKTLEAGQYGRCVLNWTNSAAVCYPNASGKHQLENCLQTSIEVSKPYEPGDDMIAFQMDGITTAQEFLDIVLHFLQKGKPEALEFLAQRLVGVGQFVLNSSLYDKKGSDKSSITTLPEV